jgi:hypothetical protein
MSGGIGCELALRGKKRWHGFILSLRDEPPFNPIPGNTYLATIVLSLRDEPFIAWDAEGRRSVP